MEGVPEKKDEHLHVQILEDKIKELPLHERVKAIALFSLQQEKQALDDELELKITEVQKQSDISSLPIYSEIQQLVQGTREPTAEELANLQEFGWTGETAQPGPIENYWGKALTNCQSLAHVWGEKDKDILKYLTGVEIEMSADTPIFTLRFTFKDNEWFKNKELTKRFILEGDDDFPKKTEGTVIEWNEGKNVTVKTVEKKQKNKKTGASRVVKKQEIQLSFFNFFKNSEEAEDQDEDDIEKDYEIGKTIQDEVIPYSLEYFLGINPEEDDYEDMDDDDEDDDEKDEDDDEDEDDDKKKKNRKKSDKDDEDKEKKNRKKSGEDAKAKPECKQQ